jgi:hypothetical protein
VKGQRDEELEEKIEVGFTMGAADELGQDDRGQHNGPDR